MSTILVVVERESGGIRAASREVFTVAAQIADATGSDWAALVIGPGVGEITGPPRVYTLGDARLAAYDPDMYAEAAAAAARSLHVGMVLMAATATGKDLGARVAHRLGVSLAQDCVESAVREEGVVFTRAPYGGKILMDVKLSAQPVVATMRPRAYPAYGANVASALVAMGVDLPERRLTIERSMSGETARLDVAEADIVVSGGRGMQGPEHWPLLEALVDVLGARATLACSRPVSDDGWRPRAEHVGQTGRTIAPILYVACGISGAIQHVAGIAGSRCIVAINKDADAPIFRIADYGIVGDLFEVVPALTEKIRASV